LIPSIKNLVASTVLRAKPIIFRFFWVAENDVTGSFVGVLP